jgi:hypothetical protein
MFLYRALSFSVFLLTTTNSKMHFTAPQTFPAFLLAAAVAVEAAPMFAPVFLLLGDLL